MPEAEAPARKEKKISLAIIPSISYNFTDLTWFIHSAAFICKQISFTSFVDFFNKISLKNEIKQLVNNSCQYNSAPSVNSAVIIIKTK